MFFIKHDFYSNFTAADDAEDKGLLFGIFASELGDLLVFNEEEIFNLFDKTNIQYNKDETYETYVDIILNQLVNGNKQFIIGLAYLMSDNNDAINQKNKNQWKVVLQNVSSGLSTIAQYLTDNAQDKALLKKLIVDGLQLRIDKAGSERLLKTEKKMFIPYLIGGLLVVAAIWVLWEAFTLKKEELPSAIVPTNSPLPSEGIQNNTPLPTNPPGTTVPPDVLIPEPQITSNFPASGTEAGTPPPKSSLPHTAAPMLENPSQLNKVAA